MNAPRSAPPSRAREWGRGLKRGVIFALLAAVALAAAVVAWMSYPRTPRPDERFIALKGSLAAVDLLGTSRQAGLLTEDLALISDTGLRIRALVRRPVEADDPLPTVVLLGGIESGRLGLLRIDTARYPFLWMALDYPYEPPARVDSFAAVLRELPRAVEGAERTVAGLMLALDYLATRPDVDGDRVLAGAGSLGTFPMVIAAAIDERFRAVALLYGGGDVARIIRTNLPWDSETLKRLAADGLNPWLGPLEPTRYVGRIAPRPLLMVNGTGDTMFPRRSVQALYEAAGEPKDLVWLETGHRIIDRPELMDRALAETVGWLEERGFLDDGGD